MQRYGYQYAQEQMACASASRADQPIIEVDGKLRFSLPGQPLFPALADDTILKPTIHWVLETDTPGKLDAELSYITGGMSWEADYSMLAQAKGEAIDVIGWVTMDNQSGKTFENAHIKLMAGDVSKIQPESHAMLRRRRLEPAHGRRRAAPVSEKAFEEYHLYTLSRADDAARPRDQAGRVPPGRGRPGPAALRLRRGQDRPQPLPRLSRRRASATSATTARSPIPRSG